MSTEEILNKSPIKEKTKEPEDQENLKKSPNSNSTSSNSQENQEIMNHPYVQDLLLKIDVLRRGILKERKTNQELQDKLKKFEMELSSKIIKLEEELVSKTSQVKTLIQEKMDLEQKLKQQKASKKKRGTGFLDILNIGLEYNDKIQNQLSNPNITKEEQQKQQKNAEEISAMANQEIRKLHEKISELKFQNETYFKKMNQSLEDAENKRMEHKNEVKNYTDKINKLENEIQKLQKEKGELNNRINTVLSMSSQNMKETEHFKVLLNDYKKDREQANKNLNSYIEKYNKLLEENARYKEALLKHEEDSGKMAQKLAELKNLMIKLNLKNQMFHVTKLGILSNTEMDILFGKSEDGNYIMRLDDKNEQEIINILDVESVEKEKGSNDKIEIIYMKNGKKINIVVMIDELIIDQMVKAYKVFFSESMKKLNQINY
jgi:DNA repair exonuclease SbcCD ATPase subunit